MKNAIRIAALAVAGLALTACVATDTNMTKEDTGMSRQGTSAAESACMAAVNGQYGGKYPVSVLSSEYAESGSLVMVAGGANRESWRCLASNRWAG
jgi:hypothetical protein